MKKTVINRYKNQLSLLSLFSLAMVFLTGCNMLGYGLHLLAPPEKKVTVKPEFAGLEGKTIAIVIWADQRIQYQYPYARLSLSWELMAELKERLEGITVIDPKRVIKFQDENIRWDMLPKGQLVRELCSDFVLLVVPDTYTMREPGALNLYRGEISAQAALYQPAETESQWEIWSGDNFRVVFPPNAATGEPGSDDRRIRHETEKRFAQLLVRNFYTHKVPESEWLKKQEE